MFSHSGVAPSGAVHGVHVSIPAGNLCISLGVKTLRCTRKTKQSSLLGTALATTNDTVIQPQGIGPDNPRADTKLIHSLITFQHAGNSSEAFLSSCSSSFSFPLILPPVTRHGKQTKHPTKITNPTHPRSVSSSSLGLFMLSL